ncbi:prepilin-type N-terminal cleavage/methylation domain-containing protein [Clostridium beijerinckii]|uniref:prepilin-type N-terminal cleavage/methylation domain-containing protein n=1 Tax=Clostridium beijerinckii TaxID=1520 RepID=UPI00047EFD06|nr:prepilin-type N-terminal cleavage/methylation domain-containing protein [Clostridium beijerinckii]
MNQLLKRKNNELSLKKKKGFTLIELIIVIAIIAILAAIAIPKFGAAKHNADVAADQANAKIIATAVSNAIAHGDIPETATSVDTTKITPYIDGGTLPKPKTGTSGGAFTITYSQGTGVVVTTTGTGGIRAYPVS